MLGSEDDLAAVLSVLDRLSNELASNRSALDVTCTAADELGGGVSVPDEMLGESGESGLEELRKERNECCFVRNSLDTAIQKVAESTALLRKIIESHERHELDFRCRASQELLEWQERVGAADDEFHQLKSQSLDIDAKLSDLYRKLQLSSINTGIAQKT